MTAKRSLTTVGHAERGHAGRLTGTKLVTGRPVRGLRVTVQRWSRYNGDDG
jgi:hypothetical protein